MPFLADDLGKQERSDIEPRDLSSRFLNDRKPLSIPEILSDSYLDPDMTTRKRPLFVRQVCLNRNDGYVRPVEP